MHSCASVPEKISVSSSEPPLMAKENKDHDVGIYNKLSNSFLTIFLFKRFECVIANLSNFFSLLSK